MAKYIKGKDGKFRGSIPDAPKLPSAAMSMGLPELPNAQEKCCSCPSADSPIQRMNGRGDDSWYGDCNCNCHIPKKNLLGRITERVTESEIWMAIFD